MSYAAININFDSLGEAYGFPMDYDDPTFGKVMDRFLSISEKWNFKYSIYVIGKDIEKAANRKALRDWSEMGHEIGNHSWSHPENLGVLPEKEIFEEVNKAHQIIGDSIGHEPKGFIAPAWCTSKSLTRVLMNLSYEYDTSTWPSLLMYPAVAKIF